VKSEKNANVEWLDGEKTKKHCDVANVSYIL